MNTPKLRFKEFSSSWKPTTIGECSETLAYGLNAAAKPFDGENQYIRITDIDDQSRTYIKKNRVSPDCELTDEYLVKENDILFTRTGASTGKSYIYRKRDGKLYFAGFLIRARIKKEHDARFIYNVTLNSSYNKWVKVMSMRSGQPGINSQEYSSYSFYLPMIKEQKKISDFFDKLDLKIELQQEKIDLLKAQKRVYIQKIFSQELRFKDEYGQDYPKWDKKKLSSVVEYYNGKTNESNIEENGKYNLINLNSISIDGRLKDTHKKTNKPTFLLNQYDLVMILSDVGFGDLLGRVSLIPEANTYVLNQRVGALRVLNNEEILPTYLYYYINNNQSYFKLMGQGMSQLNLNKNDVLSLVVSIPILQEQHKISNLLTALDKKIDLEIAKIDKLNTQKQAFMQQMFI